MLRPSLVRLWISKSSCEKSVVEKKLWKIWCEKDVGHLANQLIQLFQILARSGIRFWKARPRLLPLLVQILAADFWNRILLRLPFGSDSAARQRNPLIKDEPNRALEAWHKLNLEMFGQHDGKLCQMKYWEGSNYNAKLYPGGSKLKCQTWYAYVYVFY